jgi:hypothetical protein
MFSSVVFHLLLVGTLSSATAAAMAWTREQILAFHGGILSTGQMENLHRRLHDRSIILDELFDHRTLINRTVQYTTNGVVATTTSSDAYVAQLIQAHVTDMKHLTRPIRQCDPLFRSLFEHMEETSLEYVNITNLGVQVEHTGTTDCGVLLVQAHATQVSSFVNTGIRRPNFAWQPPAECNNPKSTLDLPTMANPVTRTTTISDNHTPSGSTTPEDGNDRESMSSTALTQPEEPFNLGTIVAALSEKEESSPSSSFQQDYSPLMYVVGIVSLLAGWCY